jgi:hypothetical protein
VVAGARLDGGLILLLERVDLAQLHVRGVVPLYRVGSLETVCRALVLLEVHVAQPLVVPDLPVVDADALRLLVHVERRLVLPEEVERAADLFQVADVVRVQAGRRLEELQRVLDLAALPLDECLDVDRVCAPPSRCVSTRRGGSVCGSGSGAHSAMPLQPLRASSIFSRHWS